MPRKIAAGNWKMNGTAADLDQIKALAPTAASAGVATLICPPASLISRAAGLGVDIGAQDCHAGVSGAHTGDLSAEMLADAGATHIITGHSERRQDHNETDADIAAKTQAVWRAGLTAIICIGESEAQYRAGETLDVIAAQLAGSVPTGAGPQNTIVAYEPIWAIGTGLTPTVDEIAKVHAFIRAQLAKALPEGAEVSLLYGGSVKASNAAEIFAVADVDGALVGGASLKAADFGPIVTALATAS